MTPAEDPKYLPIADTMLDKHGIVCVAAVKEMHDICDLPIKECRDILRKVYDSREMERIKAENVKLRELCGEMLLYIAYPYVCVRPSVLIDRAHELGIEVNE